MPAGFIIFIPMEKLTNLLIIAGTGRNSGKTTLACTIISQSGKHGIIAVKISPHEHNPSSSSVLIHSGGGFEIYRECSPGGSKDTQRMIEAGASEAYYIRADDLSVVDAFGLIYKKVPGNIPVVCESPVLRRYYVPGLFIIADSGFVQKRKDLEGIADLADLKVDFESGQPEPGIISFGEGRWFIRR